MGTRNLTMVISNGETKIAQYGQWDGYPEGQGATALEFLLNSDMKVFKSKLERCRFIENSKRKQTEMKNFLAKIGSSNGWMNGDQAEKYHKKYPFLTRDNGAKILDMVYDDDTDKLIWLNNSEDFAADSLFCEWAYVIDLDKNTFEVYEGFNKTPLTKEDRFFNLKGENDYEPIKMIKSYDLNNLPKSVNEFVSDIKELVKVED